MCREINFTLIHPPAHQRVGQSLTHHKKAIVQQYDQLSGESSTKTRSISSCAPTPPFSLA